MTISVYDGVMEESLTQLLATHTSSRSYETSRGSGIADAHITILRHGISQRVEILL